MRFSTRVKTPLVLALTCVSVSLSLCGCDRKNTSSASTIPIDSAVPTTMRETFDCLRQWYERGSYSALRSYIDPLCRDDVIDLLIAVDELMVANAAARQAIEKSCQQIDPAIFDMSVLQNEHLDLFSRDMQVVRLEEKGDQGAVMVQVGNSMPLVNLRFRRQDDRWVYVPGAMTAKLTVRLREIAYVWNQFALVVASRPQSADEVMHEFKLRVQPKLNFE